jgi:F-type H+-transporting ATPase subunit gamma
MKSVKNIQKITKAMKMVAASKLRAIQVRAENSRGLWQPFTALLGDTPSMFLKTPLFFMCAAQVLFFFFFFSN